MKRAKQMTRVETNHKWFIETATLHHNQWHLVRKLSMEIVNHFRSVSDEQAAYSLIKARHERLSNDLEIEAHELLLDYNFDVSTMYFLVEPGESCKQNRVWTCQFINKWCDYTDTHFQLGIIQFSLVRKTHEPWTCQQACNQFADIFEQVIQDAPALMYNRFRMLGLSEQAIAMFVGMKSAEMSTKGRVKFGLMNKVKDTRKGEGYTPHAFIRAEDITRAKYEALRDDMIVNVT